MPSVRDMFFFGAGNAADQKESAKAPRYNHALICKLFAEGKQTEAYALFEKAGTEDGVLRALCCMGYCLQRGLGTEKDAAHARSCYTHAQDMEGGEAAYNLASMYIRGEGMRKPDYRKGYLLMKKSAELGCVEAQIYVGGALLRQTVYDPPIVAINLIPFHQPVYADEEMLLSNYSGADMYADERGLPVLEDEDTLTGTALSTAYQMFKTAAQRGDDPYAEKEQADAKFLYARCVYEGLGCERNQAKGARLLVAAKRAGSADAALFIESEGGEERLLSKNRGASLASPQ